MGKIRSTISTDLFRYFRTMDKAMLGLPSRAVGAKTISAFFKNAVALTVTRSGSPGPHPMHTTSILDDSIFQLFKSKHLSQENTFKAWSQKSPSQYSLQASLFPY
jgi:hypothetical protein